MPSPSKKRPTAGKPKPAGAARPKAAAPAPKAKKAAPPKAPAKAPPKAAAKPAPRSGAKALNAKPRPSGAKASASEPVAEVPVRRGDGRRHLLSLSFLRDGDEFMARLETDAGQITELKNRALDQLLTLVAGELEDLLE